MSILTTRDYIDAAGIVATCSPKRLNIVLDLLAQAGIKLSSTSDKESVTDDLFIEKTIAAKRQSARKERYKDRFPPTNDPVIITLRKAYIDGYKIADIASAAGITRTAIYEYMRGCRNYSPRIRDAFITAYSKLNIPFPPADLSDPFSSQSNDTITTE